MPILRCPGPLLTLRCLAALFGVRTQSLVAALPDCEARAALVSSIADTVADELDAALRQPDAVHYFHASPLLDPATVIAEGLEPAPDRLDGLWTRLEDLVADRVAPADWLALRTAIESEPAYARRLREARRRGPRGLLIRDVALRPSAYGVRDRSTPPAAVRAIASACQERLGVDLAARYAEAATPCLIEYRREPERADEAIATALWYVAAALRGGASPRAGTARDDHGAPVPAGDVVSVRALDSETEWVNPGW